MIKRTLVALGALALLALGIDAALAQAVVVDPAPASGTSIFLGQYIQPILTAAVTAIAGIFAAIGALLAAKIREKTGKDIEWLHNGTIQRFAENQAGKFLAKFDSINGMAIDVKNPLVATLANEALSRIPDALAYFGITPEAVAARIGGMIVSKIGILTASGTVAPAALTGQVDKPVMRSG